MKNNMGISKQLIIALSIVNFSVTICSCVFGYFIYSYAVDLGWVSLESLSSDWYEFGLVDWIWLFVVLLFGSILSIFLGIRLANRFIKPMNDLADAATKISHGNLSARVENTHSESKEILELINNFNAMAQKLEASVKNAQIWNAAIAHELRTPITILQGRLQGIIDGVFVQDTALFKNLLNQVEGLSHLVEDLRTLSLIDHQQLRLNYEWVNFKEMVERVIHSFEERLANANLVPELEMVEVPVYCDQRRMEQALLALIDNAIRYSAQGKLKISSEIKNNKWQLKIEDDGPGIALQYQEQLFTPFFRLEESRNKEFGGMGLGLAVVYAIVTAHKGNLSYENKHSNSLFMIEMDDIRQ
ncbi:two-component sensor histidine kinase AdeS [Acinetobacter sp. ANC 4558]|uniref:two-component sensor histidine kinase AdeS n=1 Tax=Acinetobacter sp. ANC 4558 TaxID=1977876 RepID=UPI000A339DFB|nr:two-component sensor histidine kinase AdeS [Acinetobacter sp. ANC 4558]OTG88282.1 two-component sensor histidine kinase AdeS [Acinetobacter sp. ANC 4558]